MSNKSKLMAACASALLAGGIASQAQAAVGLQIDLKPAAGSSTEITRMGQEVTVEVWARVEGTSALTTKKQGISILTGSFVSTGGALGVFAPAGDLIGVSATDYEVGIGKDPFNGNGSRSGTLRDLDGDGDLDLGAADNSGTSYYGHVGMRSAAMTVAAGKVFNVQIGTLKYTVTDPSKAGDTLVNFLLRKNTDGSHMAGSSLYQIDGASKDTSAGVPVINGLTLTNSADLSVAGNTRAKAVTYASQQQVDTIVTDTFGDDTLSGVWTTTDRSKKAKNKVTYKMLSPETGFTGILAGANEYGPLTLTLKGVDTDGDPETDPQDIVIQDALKDGSLNFVNQVMVDGLPLAAVGFTGVESFELAAADETQIQGLDIALTFSSETAGFSATYEVVPEPATLGVLALGSLLGLRRRRQA